LILLIAGFQSHAQIYKSNEGYVSFFSEAPLENIDASSKNLVSVWSLTENEIAFSVAINSFQFKKQKMQDDFNEDYMESSKYPVATYKGKTNEKIDLKKDGSYTITSSGVLTIHGISKQRKDTATIRITDGKITLYSSFKVHVADYGIRIPKILFEHLAETVSVKLMLNYLPFKEEQKQ
jgi:hypothetical protein